jgi:hypothetical protein
MWRIPAENPEHVLIQRITPTESADEHRKSKIALLAGQRARIPPESIAFRLAKMDKSGGARIMRAQADLTREPFLN